MYVGANASIRIYSEFKQPAFFPDSACGCKILDNAVIVENQRGFQKFFTFKMLSSYKF